MRRVIWEAGVNTLGCHTFTDKSLLDKARTHELWAFAQYDLVRLLQRLSD
jgi:hypothetical protein